MKVLTFDPGGTTGVARYHDGIVTSWQIGPKDHHVDLEELLIRENPQVVVYETFKWRPNPAELISVEYIGVIKLLKQRLGFSVSPQGPDMVKPFWTDDKLKKLSLWNTNKPHANDAMRHLLYFVTHKQNKQEFLYKLKE